MNFLTRALTPFLDSSRNIDVILETSTARDLTWTQQHDKMEKACTVMQEAKSWPKLPTAVKVFVLTVHGYCSQVLKRPEKAREIYSQILELEPADLLANLYIGEMDANSGENEKALAAFGRYIDAGDAESSDFVRRAAVLVKAKKYKEAMVDYEAALKSAPDSVPILISAAHVSQILQNFEDTLKYASRATVADPGSGVAYFAKAQAYAGLEDYTASIDNFNIAIDLKYTLKGMAYIKRAHAYRVVKDFEKALADCDLALAESSELIDGWMTRASVMEELKRPEESFACMEKALEFATTDETKAAVHVNLSRIYLKTGDGEKSVTEAEIAARLAPEKPLAYNNMAFALAHLGRNTEALIAIEKACAIGPMSANLHSTRGVVLYVIGRHAEAREDFEKALEMKGALAEANYFLGLIMRQEGKHDQAVAYEAQAAKFKYDHPKFSVMEKVVHQDHRAD